MERLRSTGWRLGRRRGLDGFRGLAILLVVAAHAAIPGFRDAGVTGVTLFFVLSGFLITSLLVEERRESGRIDLRAFYRHRALRLLPALFVFLAAMAGAAPVRSDVATKASRRSVARSSRHCSSPRTGSALPGHSSAA